MKISKKKKEEFDNIFILVDLNNIVLNVDLLRKISNGDFYEHFIIYIKNKIETIIKNHNIFYLHINIGQCVISDLYNYDKILKFAHLLHEFTNELIKINIYGSSSIFTNLIHIINSSLGFDIMEKIIFENKEIFNSRFNKISIGFDI
jgi:hypothetical protein